jgi:Holliday junction resolvase-like predicted endonuclease
MTMAKLKDIQRLITSNEHTQRHKRAAESGKSANWEFWYNGVPVVKELALLIPALEKRMPHVKLFPTEFSNSNQDGKSAWAADEFAIYMDEYPYALGQVGFRDYSINKTWDVSKRSYGVYSRRINNEKYAARNDQYYMVMATTVDKAVKNIERYVTPFTNKELASCFYEKIHEKLLSIADHSADQLGQVVRGLHNRNVLINELRNLKRQGVTFITPEFMDAAGKIDEVVAQVEEEQARNTSAIFVRFKTVGNDTYADLLECVNVKAQGRPRIGELVATYSLAELPEYITSAVAVLQILENKQYAQRVGMKITDTIYWVERG